MAKYDYSKYTDESDSDKREMGYWGIHRVDGRIEVDTERYEHACTLAGIDEFLPEQIKGKREFYVPSKIERYEYTSNYLADCLNDLKEDWDDEYKPLFRSIRSPEKAKEDYFISTSAMFGDSDLIDGARTGSCWAAFERSKTYGRIINELYCLFIMKVSAEIDRMILKSLADISYQNPDYSLRDFITWCNGRNPSVDVRDIAKFNEFRKFHDVNNFLKHNSVQSYRALRKFHPECVVDADEEFENGMFACDWIVLEEADIDVFISDMREFSRDFCAKILGEYLDLSRWDYDDYFVDAFHQMKDPWEYWGIYGAVGLSPWE